MYPYWLRGVTAAYPHHVWGIAITYIRLCGTWLDLVAILDGFSRYGVSGALAEPLSLPFVPQAAERALAQATPVIGNHDQGSPFTSPHDTARLEAAGVQISRDGRGRAFDNIVTERWGRSVKYEEVYVNDYRTPRDARQGLAGDLTFYNTVRPHQALGYATPAAVYTGEVTLE